MSVRSQAPAIPDAGFVNEVRLSWKHWLITLVLLMVIALGTPRVWKKVETFVTGPDYRIPYSLSKDYWLYERRLEGVVESSPVVLLGDSVVWGEYVLPDGTLSHYLNEKAGQPARFVNAGVNGLFPLALDGLVNFYGRSLRHRKVLLNCNLLWMSSPKADLQVQKEEKFNHARLVPQFFPPIPCYKADANERISAVIERQVQFLSWANHLQTAYFADKSIPSWTLQDDGTDPPHYPNAYKNPLSQITLEVPVAPQTDPQRGPNSARHRPWSGSGGRPVQFEWVGIETSLQWRAFKHLVGELRARENDLLVVLGPFNEHMVAPESQAGYRKLREGILRWLDENHVSHAAPEPLPSEFYADASHPLTAGYQMLADKLYEDAVVQDWLKR